MGATAHALAVALCLTLLASCTDSSVPSADSTPPAPVTSPSIDTIAVTTTVASSTSQPTPLPSLERVLSVGDGVMFDLEPALAAALTPAIVRPRAYFGSGLSTPDHYDWATRWPVELAADGGAQLVVVLVGVWDAREVTTVVAGRATTLSPGTAEWRGWYGEMVAEAARTLAASGAKVMWILPLAEPDAVKAQRLADVESVIVDVIASFDDQAVLDGDTTLTGTSNRYIATGPDGSALRKSDGEHLCPSGAAMLATAVRVAAGRWFTVDDAGDWPFGAWRTDERYAAPADGCGP